MLFHACSRCRRPSSHSSCVTRATLAFMCHVCSLIHNRCLSWGQKAAGERVALLMQGMISLTAFLSVPSAMLVLTRTLVVYACPTPPCPQTVAILTSLRAQAHTVCAATYTALCLCSTELESSEADRTACLPELSHLL